MILTLVFAAVSYSDNVSHLTTGPDLELPSVWRVIGGFFLISVLALAVTVLLKKSQPWMPLAILEKQDVSVVASRALSKRTTAHVLKIGEEKFLLIESGVSTILQPLSKVTEQDGIHHDKSST